MSGTPSVGEGGKREGVPVQNGAETEGNGGWNSYHVASDRADELMSSWPTPVGAQVFRSLFVGNDIHLVLVFSESSVHSFFIAFECMATSLHWPQDVYCVMLLCTLTDKTHEACSDLLTEDCLVYKKLMILYLKPVGSISEV